MKKITALSLSCLTAAVFLAGCSGGSPASSSSQMPTLGPPQRAEFNDELPVSASYRRFVRRFDGTHFLYKNAETYDDHGSLIRITDVNVATGTETVTRTYSYTYNEDGSTAQVCDYSYVSTRKVFTYNENGSIAKTELFDADSDILKNIVTYEYNEQGDLTRSVQTDAGGKDALLSYSKYEYGENGKPSVKYEYYQNDSLKFTETYTYDNEGRLITNERINENSPVPRQIFTYEYDADGNKVLEAQTDHAPDGSVQTEAQLKSTYDQSGRIIKRESFLNGSVNWYELYDYEDIVK